MKNVYVLYEFFEGETTIIAAYTDEDEAIKARKRLLKGNTPIYMRRTHLYDSSFSFTHNVIDFPFTVYGSKESINNLHRLIFKE